jgi:hypothetical protein
MISCRFLLVCHHSSRFPIHLASVGRRRRRRRHRRRRMPLLHLFTPLMFRCCPSLPVVARPSPSGEYWQ